MFRSAFLLVFNFKIRLDTEGGFFVILFVVLFCHSGGISIEYL
jgi:hypothetical protein